MWDLDAVIPATHKKVEEYVWLTAGNFPALTDIWLEKWSKVKRKLEKITLSEWAINF